MTLYMARFAYTPEAWTLLTKHPEDRTAAVEALAENSAASLRHSITRSVSMMGSSSWMRRMKPPSLHSCWRRWLQVISVRQKRQC